MIRIAINGLGRIGRAAFKIILNTPELELVAINDLVPADNLAYLLRHDTAYGRYEHEVTVENGDLRVAGSRYKLLSEKEPAHLPWRDLRVDTVLECTGLFTNGDDLSKHLQAGARRVILSAPAKSNDITTVVYGVNHQNSDTLKIVSCASCTTNCITPLVEIMGRRIGVKKAMLTTTHAYTASQNIVDGPSRKFTRGRAGAANLVPTTTGAAVATTKVLPHYKGLFDGVAVRAPVPVGSISDVVFVTERDTSVEEVNDIFREEARSAKYQDVLSVTTDPTVSTDIIQDPHASIVDLAMTQVVDGDLVKVMSWYDNEWGYANQMVRQAVQMGNRVKTPAPTAEQQLEGKIEASPG